LFHLKKTKQIRLQLIKNSNPITIFWQKSWSSWKRTRPGFEPGTSQARIIPPDQRALLLTFQSSITYCINTKIQFANIIEINFWIIAFKLLLLHKLFKYLLWILLIPHYSCYTLFLSRMGSNLFDTGGSTPSYFPSVWSDSEKLYFPVLGLPRFWLVGLMY